MGYQGVTPLEVGEGLFYSILTLNHVNILHFQENIIYILKKICQMGKQDLEEDSAGQKQADGRAKRCPRQPVLKGRGLGAGGLGRRARGPRSTCWNATASPALSHSQWRRPPMPQPPALSSLACLARAPCLLGWRPAAALLSRPARPAPPAGQRARTSSTQGCLPLTPAPDCGLSLIQNRAQDTDVPILWLWTSFLEKSRSQASSIHL